MSGKIVSLEEFRDLREELRHKKLKVVSCHGVFDLLHPGHIAHLREAKSLGDILVVSITSAPYVNRGPGRPYFSDDLRLQSLAALEYVDYVLLIEAPTALEAISVIQPNLYVKGQEYAVSSNDVTQNIDKEIECVRSYGGDIYFTNGIVFSSTKLLNQNFPVFPAGVKEFAREFSKKYSPDFIRKVVDDMRNLKVLVVGDIIIDEYVLCWVQGLMSKDRALSVKHDRDEVYLGGALAIARHLANFSNHVTVCSIMGNESYIHSQLLNDLSGSMLLDLQFEPDFRTVIKRRFVERHGIRNEYAKLFSVNYLPDEGKLHSGNREVFYSKLKNNVGQYDLVVLADYGHGLLDQTAMDIIQSRANFLALNCQTNSSNFGMNLITKYRRADTFTIDERELRLALACNFGELRPLIEQLTRHVNAKVGWVTLGSKGSVGIDSSLYLDETPAFTLSVQDTVGAGDAFFSLTSLCARLGVDVPIGSFLGNIAGALAANILGNSRAIDRGQLLKFVSTILNM